MSKCNTINLLVQRILLNKDTIIVPFRQQYCVCSNKFFVNFAIMHRIVSSKLLTLYQDIVFILNQQQLQPVNSSFLEVVTCENCLCWFEGKKLDLTFVFCVTPLKTEYHLNFFLQEIVAFCIAIDNSNAANHFHIFFLS